MEMNRERLNWVEWEGAPTAEAPAMEWLIVKGANCYVWQGLGWRGLLM